jgi:hypothetical protein
MSALPPIVNEDLTWPNFSNVPTSDEDGFCEHHIYLKDKGPHEAKPGINQR